jgi:hypothetical protein
VACLHVLQAAVAYVKTLRVQDVLAEPAWSGALTPEDRRGLPPLFWTRVAQYGQVRLSMAKRLVERGEALAPRLGEAQPPGSAQMTPVTSRYEATSRKYPHGMACCRRQYPPRVSSEGPPIE